MLILLFNNYIFKGFAMKKFFLLICFALQFKSVVSSQVGPVFASYSSTGLPLRNLIFTAAGQASQDRNPYGTFIAGQRLVSRNPYGPVNPGAAPGRSRSPSPKPDDRGFYHA
jgi:hypothetical protein